jgi:hypothetical protein
LGSQTNAAAQTVTNVFTGLTVPTGSQWEYQAVLIAHPAAGTQGAQFGVQCSVGGATVFGRVVGAQTTTGDASYAQTAQGSGTLPIQRVAGSQTVELKGIITVPGSGSPVIGVQIKGVQASQAWGVDQGYLKITKTS